MVKNKFVVITGASSGIGKAIAIDCAKKGFNVALVARSTERLNVVASKIKKYNVRVLVVPIDVSNKKEVEKGVKKIIENFKRVDILINNAGIGIYGNFSEKRIQDIEKIIQTNLLGTIYMTKAVLPFMIKQKHCHIVNVGSVLSKIGLKGMADYAASKFGVSGFSESLYQELKPLGIDISVIYPGYVKTMFYDNISFKNSEIYSPIKGIDAEDVSAVVMKALKEKKFEYFVPKFYGHLMKGKSLFPGAFRKLQQRK